MKRMISEIFVNDLNKGKLQELLSYVKSDNTLDIEIREDIINIYYRGGNALKVTDNGSNNYDLFFDENYFNVNQVLIKNNIDAYKSKSDWINYFPLVKQGMDFYFTKHKEEEREFQQHVVRENNYSSVANSTDYFIIDIEYANHRGARFDLVAMEWQSDASIRKLTKGYKPKLVVIEMKYGDGALKNSAGMHKHISDFEKFSSNTSNVKEFKDEMLSVFNQKLQLGLIPTITNRKDKDSLEKMEFADEFEMLFLIANHNPASSILRTEFNNLKNKNVKFIASNFNGYGIFKENVFDYNQFIQRFKSQI